MVRCLSLTTAGEGQGLISLLRPTGSINNFSKRQGAFPFAFCPFSQQLTTLLRSRNSAQGCHRHVEPHRSCFVQESAGPCVSHCRREGWYVSYFCLVVAAQANTAGSSQESFPLSRRSVRSRLASVRPFPPWQKMVS